MTLTITEAPGKNLVCQIESEPPLPILDGDLDWERADSPQTAAMLASKFIAELGDHDGGTITASDHDDAARKVRARFGL